MEIVLCSVSLLIHIWVQVEHSLLPRQIYKRISCNSSRLHVGCVWTYEDELNGSLTKSIFDDLVREIFGKYLQISNSIFTVLLAPDKKIILRCFFQLEVICLCAKFYAYPTPATCFLPKNVTFLTYLQWQYFSFIFCRVFHHSKVEFSDLDQNWAKNMPLLFKTFKLPNSMAWHIVHWLEP